MSQHEIVKEKARVSALEELIESEDMSSALHTYLIKTLDKIPKMRSDLNIEFDLLIEEETLHVVQTEPSLEEIEEALSRVKI